MQEEFYAVAFRKKLYNSLEEMQRDLDQWMKYYNHERTHSGRYCYGKTPMETFNESIILARQKLIGRVSLQHKNISQPYKTKILCCQIKCGYYT
jgi:hypothetical protein